MGGVARAEEPELARCSGGRATVPTWPTWLDQCRDLLGRYFTLEDPQRLEPAEREVHVATELESGLTIHGYIDRVDVAPTGEIRIVDYKTGRSPGEFFEAKALFQMKFYALVVWRTRGVIPRMLQLVYLGNGEMLRYEPDERDLLATERKVDGAVGGDPARQRDRRVAAQQVRALRLVRPPGDLPRVGWHSSPAARGAATTASV